MSCAGVAYQDSFLLYGVAALAVCGAGVDGVLEVHAFADGESFNDFVAHGCGFWFVGYAESELGQGLRFRIEHRIVFNVELRIGDKLR